MIIVIPREIIDVFKSSMIEMNVSVEFRVIMCIWIGDESKTSFQ